MCSAKNNHRNSLILQCGLKTLPVEERMDPDLLWLLHNNQQLLLLLSQFCKSISNHILFCCLRCTQHIFPGFRNKYKCQSYISGTCTIFIFPALIRRHQSFLFFPQQDWTPAQTCSLIFLSVMNIMLFNIFNFSISELQGKLCDFIKARLH